MSSPAVARQEPVQEHRVRLRVRSRARKQAPSITVCLGAGLAVYLASSLVSASLAELWAFEAKRMGAAAVAVRDISDIERERADRRSALRAVEQWAARNGFVDGRSKEVSTP